MKIPPAEIGFDIDGVVADTASAFLRIARQEHGAEGISLEDITEFEVENCLPLAPELIAAIFQRLLEDPLEADMQPMGDAVTVLTTISATAPLTFITARPLEKPIALWLEKHLGPEVFHRCRLIAMGAHDEKSSWIASLGLKYFIDDRAQTCHQLESHGITPIVFEQPWNRGKHHFYSVNSWRSILDLFDLEENTLLPEGVIDD